MILTILTARLEGVDLEMAKPIIVLSGKVGVGKSTVAARLCDDLGAIHAQTSSMILALRPGTQMTRVGLQREGNDLDRATDYGWISEELHRIANAHPGRAIIVDAVRVPCQVGKIRALMPSVFHIHLRAERREILARFANRQRAIDGQIDYETLEADPSEQWDGDLAAVSDFTISTDNLTPAAISRIIVDFANRGKV